MLVSKEKRRSLRV